MVGFILTIWLFGILAFCIIICAKSKYTLSNLASIASIKPNMAKFKIMNKCGVFYFWWVWNYRSNRSDGNERSKRGDFNRWKTVRFSCLCTKCLISTPFNFSIFNRTRIATIKPARTPFRWGDIVINILSTIIFYTWRFLNFRYARFRNFTWHNSIIRHIKFVIITRLCSFVNFAIFRPRLGCVLFVFKDVFAFCLVELQTEYGTNEKDCC